MLAVTEMRVSRTSGLKFHQLKNNHKIVADGNANRNEGFSTNPQSLSGSRGQNKLPDIGLQELVEFRLLSYRMMILFQWYVLLTVYYDAIEHCRGSANSYGFISKFSVNM